MNEALPAANAALAVADANLVTVVQSLRPALIARGAAVKGRERARQGTGGEAATAQDVIRAESEAFVASVGGYANAERVELVVYLPVGWRS